MSPGNSQAASPPRPALRCRTASRTASGAGSTRSRPTPGGSCSSRRPTRSASRCSCGGPPSSSGSLRKPRRRRSTPDCSRSARRFASVTRWCARRRIARRLQPSATRCTRRSPRPPTPSADPTGARGTAPRRHPGRTSTSPRSSSVRPPARRARGGSRRPPPFSSARRRSRPSPPTRARRLLAAAQAKRDAGALEAALHLLTATEDGTAVAAAGRRDRAPAGADRLRPAPRRRCGAAAQRRGEAPGTVRRRAGTRDAPRGARRGDLGRRRRRAGRSQQRPRRAAPAPPASPDRAGPVDAVLDALAVAADRRFGRGRPGARAAR